MRNQICVGALALWMAGAAFAHGGGLNAEGCHTNRKTGDYHCHRGGGHAPRSAPLSGPTSEPGHEARPATRAARGPAVGAPTCYTGPRGGTYTITASGRKNYGGC